MAGLTVVGEPRTPPVSRHFRLKPARKIAISGGDVAGVEEHEPNDRGCLMLARSILRHDAKLGRRRAMRRGLTLFN
jgi:hypothetical protein